MAKIFPITASSRDLQKNYRSLFDRIIQSKEPLVILNKNKPEVVIIDIGTFENLMENTEGYEQQMAKRAIENYEKEKKEKKLKKLNSLADLM